MKKIIIITFLLLFLTGCSSLAKTVDLKPDKVAANAINKMEINNISGYTLDLSMYGYYKKTLIDEMVKVQNYKNESFYIEKRIDNFTEEFDTTILKTYVVDDKIYNLNTDNTLTMIDATKYTKTSIFLDMLTEVVFKDEVYTEILNDTEYKKYNFILKKADALELFSDTSVPVLEIENDVSGILYIDPDNYVYLVRYKVDNLTVDAMYLDINKVKEIKLP